MVSARDRIISLVEYLKDLGIEVNYAKNKAQGKKGFFKVKSDRYRIDISKELTDIEALSVIVHEFSHYVHYVNDKDLKSLDFIIKQVDSVLMEELITLTVDTIPKDSIKPLFELKDSLKKEILNLQEQNFNLLAQIELNSKQKVLKRINSRISRLNSYYNSATELFARSMEKFALDRDKFELRAPNLYPIYCKFVSEDEIMSKFFNILLK